MSKTLSRPVMDNTRLTDAVGEISTKEPSCSLVRRSPEISTARPLESMNSTPLKSTAML